MNNRTDLLAAMHRRLPNRIPYTYEARPETEERLRTYLGKDASGDLGTHFASNRFSSIWQALGQGPQMPERQKRYVNTPDVHFDTWGVKRERKNTGIVTYWEITEYPLAYAETVADVERYDWPTVDDVVFPDAPAGFDWQNWKADRVVLDMAYLGPFGLPWALRGMEQLMIDMALNPEVADAIVTKVEEYTLACLGKVLAKYPGVIDAIGSGDDYGTQNGLFISTDMMRRFFMPSLKRHYDLGRKHGVMGYHHCCGAIFEAIPLFIDAGVQVLNPIQTSAAGMAPERLKQEYGKDLCFHGAIDIQQTLVNGTPADVRSEVRHRIDTLGPEGYILGSSHVLQPDTPPENIVAMYEEARDYGTAVCRR